MVCRAVRREGKGWGFCGGNDILERIEALDLRNDDLEETRSLSMTGNVHRIFVTMAAALAAIATFPQWVFQLDSTFRTQITQQNVNSIVIMPSEDLLISGQIRFPGDMSTRGSARLHSDGERDQSFTDFNGGGKLTPWDGKYYVGIGQTVRRLLGSGYLDPSFIGLNLGPYFSSLSGGDYHVFDDGRVLITGHHILSDSIRGFEGSYHLIWFSNEGYLDTTRIHRQANGVMWDFTALPDGKFLCSCSCTEYEGQPVDRVFRIHPDGTLDTTFHSGINWGIIFSYLPLPDGRVYVGGRFKRAAAPEDTLYLVRLMPDGSLDAAFNNDNDLGLGGVLSPSPQVNSIVPWEQDRLFVAGHFRSVNDATRGGLAVVDTSGQLLPYLDQCLPDTFDYFGNTAASILGITPTGDNTGFYIWGVYAGYSDGTINDPDQRFVSRLLVEEVNVAVEEPTKPPGSSLRVHPNPTSGAVIFSVEGCQGGNGQIVIRDLHGRIMASIRITAPAGQQTWNTAGLAPGTYFVEYLRGEQLQKTEKLIVDR